MKFVWSSTRFTSRLSPSVTFVISPDSPKFIFGISPQISTAILPIEPSCFLSEDPVEIPRRTSWGIPKRTTEGA